MEPTPASTHPKFVRWALLVGILVVLNVFFFVIQQLAFPAPDYATYCPQPKVQATNAGTCDAQGGIWTEYPAAVQQTQTAAQQPTGYCDYTSVCQPKYDAARGQQHLYAFILMMVFGIASLIIGLMPIGSSIVSSGLSYGGVVTIIIAAVQYWGDAGQWLRLAISAVALIALIGIGIRKFKD